LPEINSQRKRNPALSTQNSKDNKFKVYPNPANNYFIVEYKLESKELNSEIQIINNLGKIIKIIKLDKRIGEEVIDTKSLSSGIYMINLYINGKIIDSQKLSISN